MERCPMTGAAIQAGGVPNGMRTRVPVGATLAAAPGSGQEHGGSGMPRRWKPPAYVMAREARTASCVFP